MELQASYIPARPFVSECPLPEPPPTAVYAATCVVAAPDAAYTVDQLRAAAIDLVRAAGLPALEFSVSISLLRSGAPEFTVMAYDPHPERNTFDRCSAYACTTTFEGVLCALATKLVRWAMREGLLDESPAYAGKELATC